MIFGTLDYTQALETHRHEGGWLLYMGDGRGYLVTDDEGVVEDVRGTEFIRRCETAACWDETRLPD